MPSLLSALPSARVRLAESRILRSREGESGPLRTVHLSGHAISGRLSEGESGGGGGRPTLSRGGASEFPETVLCTPCPPSIAPAENGSSDHPQNVSSDQKSLHPLPRASLEEGGEGEVLREEEEEHEAEVNTKP